MFAYTIFLCWNALSSQPPQTQRESDDGQASQRYLKVKRARLFCMMNVSGRTWRRRRRRCLEDSVVSCISIFLSVGAR